MECCICTYTARARCIYIYIYICIYIYIYLCICGTHARALSMCKCRAQAARRRPPGRNRGGSPAAPLGRSRGARGDDEAATSPCFSHGVLRAATAEDRLPPHRAAVAGCATTTTVSLKASSGPQPRRIACHPTGPQPRGVRRRRLFLSRRPPGRNRGGSPAAPPGRSRGVCDDDEAATSPCFSQGVLRAATAEVRPPPPPPNPPGPRPRGAYSDDVAAASPWLFIIWRPLRPQPLRLPRGRVEEGA